MPMRWTWPRPNSRPANAPPGWRPACTPASPCAAHRRGGSGPSARWRSCVVACADAEHAMQVSAIVLTYNWPAALARVLASLTAQTRLPDEVIVADDGSGAETRELIERMERDFPVPLRHVWQEDRGFRAARARNRGIAASR